jgi:hypothetical protein
MNSGRAFDDFFGHTTAFFHAAAAQVYFFGARLHAHIQPAGNCGKSLRHPPAARINDIPLVQEESFCIEKLYSQNQI